MNHFDPVSLEIMWSRMLSIAEEMWTTVLRTAVSTIIASANDFGCEILDARGRSIAHAYRSMPVFNMTMPNVTKAILEKYRMEDITPGDVFMTNDPWLCAGHLFDHCNSDCPDRRHHSRLSLGRLPFLLGCELT